MSKSRLVTASLIVAVVTAALGFSAVSNAAPLDIGLVQLPAPAQPNTIVLPTADGPNTEIWHASEGGHLAVRNVSNPTLTRFSAVGNPSGAAVIIAPGGGFLGLEMDKEGWDVARWFASHGVTAFVLKYRTLTTPRDQKLFVAELDKMIHGQPAAFAPPADTPPEALADAVAAIRYVRSNAGNLGVDAHRVGFMGFSAGGFIARSLVEKGGVDRPDFVAPIYPNMAPIVVPADAPPMFVAIAADDFLMARVKGFPLVESYRAAGRSVEFHLFASGGHGFAAGLPGSPEEGWRDLMLRWMRHQNMLGAAAL